MIYPSIIVIINIPLFFYLIIGFNVIFNDVYYGHYLEVRIILDQLDVKIIDSYAFTHHSMKRKKPIIFYNEKN